MQLHRESLAMKFLPNLDGYNFLQLDSLVNMYLSLLFQNDEVSPSIVSIVPKDLNNSSGGIHLIVLLLSYIDK